MVLKSKLGRTHPRKGHAAGCKPAVRSAGEVSGRLPQCLFRGLFQSPYFLPDKRPNPVLAHVDSRDRHAKHLRHAPARVSEQIDERQFQIFDLYVIKDLPSGRVAKMLGVSVARVYLSKHRVGALVRKEVRRLEKASEEALQKPA